MLIELNESDLQLLGQVLRNERRSLLNEIAHTDSREYRADLRQRHDQLESIARELDRASGDLRAGRAEPARTSW